MKKETLSILKHELDTHEYANDGKYDIYRLFKIFTETEIEHYKDLFNANLAQEFKDFILNNLSKLRGLPRNPDGSIQELEILEARALAHKVSYPLVTLNTRFYQRDQEHFVDNVEKAVGNTKPKILEVGSGVIPFSSFKLAQCNIGKISTMDKFYISNKSIENLDCTPYNEYFLSTTNIDDYDIVVANKACLAIEPIVKHCKEKNKPYLMKLCDCEAPGGTMQGWHDYLPQIDPNIKFGEKDYAYNLDL